MVFIVGLMKSELLGDCYESFVGELENFFNIARNYSKPKIFVVADREAVNQLVSISTKDEFVAWSDKKNLYVLNRNCFVNLVSDEDYLKLIKHELCHCYFYLVSNGCDKPRWLFEGLAIYLSGQNIGKSFPKIFSDFLLDYEDASVNGYKEFGFAVEFLIKYYGKNKFLELVRSLKYIASQEKFVGSFEEVYGFELKYENFKV